MCLNSWFYPLSHITCNMFMIHFFLPPFRKLLSEPAIFAPILCPLSNLLNRALALNRSLAGPLRLRPAARGVHALDGLAVLGRGWCGGFAAAVDAGGCGALEEGVGQQLAWCRCGSGGKCTSFFSGWPWTTLWPASMALSPAPEPSRGMVAECLVGSGRVVRGGSFVYSANWILSCCSVSCLLGRQGIGRRAQSENGNGSAVVPHHVYVIVPRERILTRVKMRV